MVIPKHIALIMDGNGRWARKKNLSRTIDYRPLRSLTARRLMRTLTQDGFDVRKGRYPFFSSS